MPEITYIGTGENGVDEFHLLADGNSDGTDRRPVLVIAVDQNDCIWIRDVRKTTHDAYQRTKGTVHRHPLTEIAKTDPETAALVDITGIVDGNTDICMGAMWAYIEPRIATLMARVYIPKEA